MLGATEYSKWPGLLEEIGGGNGEKPRRCYSCNQASAQAGDPLGPPHPAGGEDVDSSCLGSTRMRSPCKHSFPVVTSAQAQSVFCR